MINHSTTSMKKTQQKLQAQQFFGRLPPWIIRGLLTAVDCISILIAMQLSYMTRLYIMPKFFQLLPFDTPPDTYLYYAVPFSFVFLIHYAGLYRRRIPSWEQARELAKVCIYAMLIVLVIMYFTGTAKYISRIYVLLIWVYSWPMLCTSRYVLQRVLRFMGASQVPLIIIGAGKTSELILRAFNNDVGFGYQLVGMIDDSYSSAEKYQHIPVLGKFDDAREVVIQSGVKDVLIAAPSLPREKLLEIVFLLQPHVNNITFAPDLFGVPVNGLEINTLFNEKIILLNIHNNLTQPFNRFTKRTFDVFGSLSALIVLCPIFALIALLTFIQSGSPVIFKHQRIGLGGKRFLCYKFRTMIHNAEEVLVSYLETNPEARKEWEADFKLRNDPRISRLGGFLRRTSLDELPQLYNVLLGEMSLVGPRPIISEEVVKYGSYIYDYYLVRPGITGFWQVSGRNDVDYAERVQMDSWYVRNWSLWLDIEIIFKTVGVVLGRKGAY